MLIKHVKLLLFKNAREYKKEKFLKKIDNLYKVQIRNGLLIGILVSIYCYNCINILSVLFTYMKDTSYMNIYTIIFVHDYAIIVYSTIIIYIFLAIFLFPTFSRFV